MSNTAAEQATNKLQKCLRKWRCDEESQETDDNRLQTLEELCRQGADLNYLERERGFALIPHVFWCEKLIKFFIDRGADINSQNEDGDTALNLVIRNAFSKRIPLMKHRYDIVFHPIKLVEFLLEQSADPNIANLYGYNAILSISTVGSASEAYGRYPLKIAELILERGADVEASDSAGQSVLHIHSNNINGVFIKVYKGDVDVRNSGRLYSQTPLMLAASKDCLKNCQMLVERGADVNTRDLQGFTALHSAVLNGAHKCAEFLVKMEADPRAKSVDGKDAYDLNVFNYENPFTFGATPTEQLKIYEMAGAVRIIRKNGEPFTNLNGQANEMWDQAMDICKTFDLQPSKEFLENYEHLRQNSNLPNENLYQIAIETISRLSQTEMSKFWNLLKFTPRRKNLDNIDCFFHSLNSLEEEFKRVEDFTSIDFDDLGSLLNLAEFFEFWLKDLLRLKNEAQPQRISHLHSIARLSIACFKKVMDETNSNIVSLKCSNIYVSLCYVLTLLHFRFHDVISEKGLKDTERLLRTLVQLDVRNMTCNNSLMHRILRNDLCINAEFQSIVGAMIDFEFVDVKTRNKLGFEPAQWICWKNWQSSENSCTLSSEVLVKLAARGAHIDVRNYWGGDTIRDVFQKKERWDLSFRYDNLQCACARVLARSLVPYVNRVPKHMVHFIRMHDVL